MDSSRNLKPFLFKAVLFLIGLALLFGQEVYAQIISSFSATSTPLTSGNATSIPPISGKFAPSDRVYTDDAVKVRTTPVIASPPMGIQASGTPATIIGGPVFADEFTWWNVDYDDSAEDGWSIEDHLVGVETSKAEQSGYSPTGEVRLTNSLAHRSGVRIFGDNVVWAENRNGNLDIYLYNLTTGTETRLTAGTGDESQPSLYANRILYVDRRPNQNNDGHDVVRVYLRDPLTGNEQPLSANSEFQSEPLIYGDSVAYIETSDKSIRVIFLYNFLTNTKEFIASGKNFGNLGFAGDYLVWTDMSGGSGKVNVYNLKTKTAHTLAGHFGDQVNPAVSPEGKVVFGARSRTGGINDWRVYIHDLVSNTEDVIDQEIGSKPEDLSISGNLVSWSRNGEIYLYDINTGTESKLTNLSGEQKEPHLNDRTLVWIDGRNGTDDIYIWKAK